MCACLRNAHEQVAMVEPATIDNSAPVSVRIVSKRYCSPGTHQHVYRKTVHGMHRPCPLARTISATIVVKDGSLSGTSTLRTSLGLFVGSPNSIFVGPCIMMPCTNFTMTGVIQAGIQRRVVPLSLLCAMVGSSCLMLPYTCVNSFLMLKRTVGQGHVFR